MSLVAFNGQMGSGKDTAGERLAEMVAIQNYRLSFARLLKESAAALLDIEVESWETYKNNPEARIFLTVGYEVQEVTLAGTIEGPHVVREFTAREFLQRYGTESHRNVFGTNFWVDQCLSYIPQDGLSYVTDCRFENEAEAVLSLGGVVVNVLGHDEDTGSHASEAKLPDHLITFYIDNTVRDDGFNLLDRQLRSVASTIGIPLK